MNGRKAMLALAAALTIGAADGDDQLVDRDGDGTITLAEAALASEQMSQLDPGFYRSDNEILDFSVRGVDDFTRTLMKRSMRNAPDFSFYCVGEERDRPHRMEKLTEVQGTCSYDKYSFRDGVLDAQMLCRNEDQGEVRVVMKGKMTTTGSEVLTHTLIEMEGGVTMETVIRTIETRIGDCLE